MSFGLAKRASAPTRQQAVQIKSVMAPTGGVNARDALANMPNTDAIVMDNWFPTPSSVNVRNGSKAWATGLGSAVETVAAFNGLTTRSLWAWAGGNIYNVTSSGAVGTPLVTGLGSSRWQCAMFNAGGGQSLLAVDGVDAPLRYDGGTQGSVGILGNLVGGAAYVNGTYNNVPLTGGAGTGAQATIVVAGNAVTTVTLTSAVGSGYHVGDTLSASNANLGGAGAGFSIKVLTIGGWSTTTIAGTNTLTGQPLGPSNLITVTIHQQRAWYIEANTMNVWYGAVSAYQGTLTLLPLGQVFKMGGYLMQMATWTIDNVAGINDYAAFISSEGEVAVYQGYDPSSISTWSLVGTFRMGRPIGRRCIVKYASDVLVICTDGLAPLSKELLSERTMPDALLTFKIMNAINNDAQTYGTNFGWQCIEHPLGNKLILNVPEVPDGTAHQWVMNSINSSWCRFRNWNANCWEIQQDNLYFGGAGTVYLADVGTDDAGSPILVDCKPAFSYFDSETQKVFLQARPIFSASSPVSGLPIVLNLDFEDIYTVSPFFLSATSSLWDVSPWDTTSWVSNVRIRNWVGITGIGYAASGRITFNCIGVSLSWQSIDYAYDEGGPL
jgi:hypothetical protein